LRDYQPILARAGPAEGDLGNVFESKNVVLFETHSYLVELQ